MYVYFVSYYGEPVNGHGQGQLLDFDPERVLFTRDLFPAGDIYPAGMRGRIFPGDLSGIKRFQAGCREISNQNKFRYNLQEVSVPRLTNILLVFETSPGKSNPKFDVYWAVSLDQVLQSYTDRGYEEWDVSTFPWSTAPPPIDVGAWLKGALLWNRNTDGLVFVCHVARII